jgi:hypothetical protein
VPSYTLEEQLQNDNRAAAQLEGLGTFVDNGWDRWHYLVTDGLPNQLTIRLTVAEHITWWKKIEIDALSSGTGSGSGRWAPWMIKSSRPPTSPLHPLGRVLSGWSSGRLDCSTVAAT